ncbi:hypothetical protein [Halorubrum sp. PV6]|uniref:hypothetical protein n=1 Tax=Halorubrum sp. PV6 TaxID=634157 RepID=UPI000F858A66|nr:hypothetical protein [Halorubrum sp. PV6]AZQ13772.1 hypothetical protein DOS48_02455 [Halorubrum sp. PV6]
MRSQIDPSNFEKRYESFRDDDGEWSFEIQEYHADLNLITPSDVPATLSPKEAYRAAVFLEGFIQEKKSTGDWSDSVLDGFNKFESTIEVEAVAKALRELSNQNEPI